MSEKIDPRVIRTREILQDSLMELIKEHPFESITVKTITELARVNRSTFYAHYKDTYHLLSDCIAQRINHVDMDKPGFLGADPVQEYMVIVKEGYMFYEQNLSLALVLFKELYSSPYMSDFWDNNITTARSVLRSLHSDEKSYLVPPDIIAEYLIAGGCRVILRWLENGMTPSVDEVSVQFVRTFFLNACAMIGIDPPENIYAL